MVAGDTPERYSGVCGTDCVDLFRTTDGSHVGLVKEIRVHVIVLEDVQGKTVIVGFGGPAEEFDEFVPETQEVIDSVEWRGE